MNNHSVSPLHPDSQSSGPFAQLIAIASGKGGVGKTNMAANLACCLADSSQQVLLVDADLSLGNIDILLNIPAHFNIGHTVTGRKTLEEIVADGPCGMDVACGASGVENLANLTPLQQNRLQNELNKARQRYDTILLDTGAGISKSVISFCLQADCVLVVTTPESTAMTDAYSMIKVLVRNGYSGQINLVVNMAETTHQGKKTYQRLATVARQFLKTHVYCGAIVLRDENLRAAVNARQPVVLASPRANSSTAIRTLAARLGHTLNSPVRRPFFNKVKCWFS